MGCSMNNPMNNQAAIRVIYPQIDWDEYDREVRRATVERIRAALNRLPEDGDYAVGIGDIDAILDAEAQ
jgi:hypothetical protein